MKYRIGDKVVPHRKSVGTSLLGLCSGWKDAQSNNQPYLYIVDLKRERYVLSNLDETETQLGTHYLESDLTPYVEESIIKKGDKALFRDSEQDTWMERIFLADLGSMVKNNRYVTVYYNEEESYYKGEPYRWSIYKYMKPLPQSKDITITLDGKEHTLSLDKEKVEEIKKLIGEES